MDDKELAEIFYIIVHDFSDTILKEGISQKKIKETTYRDVVANINNWAYENEYRTIEERSYNLLRKFNAAGV